MSEAAARRTPREPAGADASHADDADGADGATEANDATEREEGSGAGEAAAAPATPSPTRKKKAKAKGAARDEAREDVPAFAIGFPRDAALDALVAAFEAGDYARVREGAAKLIHETKRDEVRAAARELLRRLEPDPLAKALVALAGALLVILSAWYWTHPHHP